MASRVIDNVTKSPSDKREYRGLELENGMKVLLISDSEADKSAGALSVGVGAMNDPVELPGLAHFCEHMVFLGTGKYPDESGFDKFLCSHGGGSNASTYSDHTTYRFDVSPDNFEETLDRFAQFFINPLFNENATEREVNAVNSENDKNIPNDDRRSHLVEKACLDQNHPYSKFSTGNFYSLWTRPKEKSINVRDQLLKFHEAYYSANIMSLTVLGKESLDKLQSMTLSMFSEAVSKNVELPSWPETPYPENVCQMKINISPIKDLRKLSILFPAPDMNKFYKSATVQYLTHLVGHEGPGSLLSLLKKKNWSNRLSSWSSTCGRGSAQFRVEVDLSIEGLEHQDEVIHHIFQVHGRFLYINLLKASGPQKWIWDEIRELSDIKFRFKEKSRAETYVFALAQKVHNCPNLEDILSAGYLMSEYRPDLICQVLNGFVPERIRVTTLSKTNDERANMVEPWYKAKYFTEKIDPCLIKKWGACELHPELALPPRNEFIPSVFELKPRENDVTIPRLVVHNKLVSGWFLQDNEYLLPKGSIFLELFSPLPLTKPLSYALNHMMVELIVDELTEFAYMAELAGVWYSIKGTEYGVELHFGGYDQKLDLLVKKVLDKILNFTCNTSRLTVLLERYKRALKNWEDEEPRVHAVWYATAMFEEKKWTKKELLEVVDEVTPENLVDYARRFITSLKLNFLTFGNFTTQESSQLMAECQKMFEEKGTTLLTQESLIRTREIKLPSGSDIVFERDHLVHSNSCALVYFQFGKQSDHDNVLLKLLDQLLSEACYTTLRTQEQLGYIVGTFVRKLHSTTGFAILVQSIFHPEYLESRIDNFLEQQYTSLKQLPDEQFRQYKEALAVVIAEKPKTLDGRASRLWKEVTLEQYNFDRQKVELQELEKITKAEALNFFESLFGVTEVNAKGRAAVHIISLTDDGAGKNIGQNYPNPIPATKRIVKKIDNLNEWKEKQEFCEFCEPALDISKPAP